jgi:hypothetical protein
MCAFSLTKNALWSSHGGSIRDAINRQGNRQGLLAAEGLPTLLQAPAQLATLVYEKLVQSKRAQSAAVLGKVRAVWASCGAQVPLSSFL